MSKVLIIAGLDRSLLLFRGDLIRKWLSVGHEVVAAAPGSSVAEDLRQMGVKYYSIPLNRTGLNPFKDLVLFFSLIHLLRTEQPSHLFLYTIKPVIYASLAAYLLPACRVFSMITGLGYVFTDESGGASKLLVKPVTFLYKLALKRCEKVFFQNPDDVGVLTASGAVEKRNIIMLNGSGVNTEHYYQAPMPGGTPVFLLIARLLKEKGINEYVDAAKMVKTKYPQVIFKMIGWALEGGTSVIKAEQVKMWQEEGIVEIIRETKDVRPFMMESSVYVLPSYYREGTPRTVLEAMAMGRPIITTDAPGCRETVVEGVNGFLVPVKDSNALAATMERFIRDPELITKMGMESRRIAEEKYDVHQVNEVINRAMGLV